MNDKTFGHSNRHSMIDMFRPPNGFRLGGAIGTTYSVDFVTLTSIMLAFVDSEIEENEKYNVPQQLMAITRLSEKFQLFVNRSSILYSDVKQSSRIFAIYDRMINEVALKSGSFHPKVWFLKYTPKSTCENVGRSPIYRLICSSRNVTAANSWELAVQLDGKRSSKRENRSIGSSLAKYFARIKQHNKSKSKLLDNAIEILPSIEFQLPPEFGQCSFDFQWPSLNKLVKRIPGNGKQATVVSPFVGSTFISDICKRFDDVTLVSTRRELDMKLNNDLAHRLQPNLYFVNDEMSADVNTRLRLHAKLYMFDIDGQQKMLLGSANATQNAWQGNNCEAIINLDSGISQSNFLEQFVYKDKGKGELNPWIEQYTIEDWDNREPETEDEKVAAKLDAAQSTLINFEFELKYSSAQNQLSLHALTEDKLAEIRQLVDGGLEIHAIPISLIEPDDASQWTGNGVEQAFSATGIEYAASVARLTEFICFRIHHARSDRSRTFVLKAKKHDFCRFFESRDKELMRAELTAKQFAQFLAAVLFDDHPQGSQAIETILTGTKCGGGGSRGAFSVAIEDVMRSCTEDDSRIAEVSKIIDTFEGNDRDGNPYIGDDFRKFWTEFRLAFDHVGEV